MNEDEEMREKCEICGHTRQWHKDNRPQHPFTPSGGSKAFLGDRRHRNRDSTSQRPAQRGDAVAVSVAQWPFDPVLRQALVDKGIITTDDLKQAQDKIASQSVIFNMGGYGGESAEETRRG